MASCRLESKYQAYLDAAQACEERNNSCYALGDGVFLTSWSVGSEFNKDQYSLHLPII